MEKISMSLTITISSVSTVKMAPFTTSKGVKRRKKGHEERRETCDACGIACSEEQEGVSHALRGLDEAFTLRILTQGLEMMRGRGGEGAELKSNQLGII